MVRGLSRPRGKLAFFSFLFSLFTFLFSLSSFPSCQRMTLYDLEAQTVNLVLRLNLALDLEIDVDVDVDVDVEHEIPTPEYNKVLFYDPDDSQLRYTEFVGTTGGTIHTPPGAYDMLVYSFGTEYIQIRNEGDINTIEAFTSDITATKSAALQACTRNSDDRPAGPIIYAPDHLLVVRDPVVIPRLVEAGQDIVIQATCHTIVKTYSFEAHSVIGAQYIESCEAFVTNQARSSFFGRGEVSNEPATLSFPVGVDRRKGCLYTTFNTFGKLPGESRSYLHIIVRDTGGNEYYYSEDITDQFDRPDNHIVITEEVDIPKPSTGAGAGISPSVDPWTEETQDVAIG